MMAGDWIKMRLDLPEDPAVMRMADELGVREEVVVGYLHAFWSWVSRQCNGESVTGVTLVSLGRRLNLHGFPELLCDVGWLEYDDSGDQPVMRIPSFERHLSQSAKSRANGQARQKKHREVVTQVSRTKRDKTVTREEKRREENNTHTQAEGFEEHWKRWCEFRFACDGVKVNQIQADTILMDLHRRGADKAKKDIDFSIMKGARSILDSSRDFQSKGNSGTKEKLRI
jgi:hypothetical protein